MSNADAVKVAVRVRPFTQQEINMGCRCVVKMDKDETIITNPETGGQHKFTFDHSYWSHNPSDSNFASQETLFSDLGKSVVDNALSGFNCTLFAYGQTGSGKSYSMVGYEDPGIVPRVCRELFGNVEQSKKEGSAVSFRVEVSMIEIYNEHVRDLFNPRSIHSKTSLRVREHPKTGPYVEGLEHCVVHSYDDISRLMEEGNKMRTIAKTNMNDTSSRAHTIFQIVFTQTKTTTTKEQKVVNTERVSKLNLVDLAGSERATKSGAVGERLKEGSAINMSLTVLGNVINKLADMAGAPPGARKKIFVPYRDSCLTWLLKESLGGNSKTIMIAALSPADYNYSESLSTLRYATRAKSIQNKAKVNEDASTKLINELKDEIDRLKNLLSSMMSFNEANEEKTILRDQLEESQRIIKLLTLSNEEKEQRTLELQLERQKLLSESGIVFNWNQVSSVFGVDPMKTPRLVNLNEDPLMAESLVYFLRLGITKIGKNKESSAIVLTGLNIQEDHAIIEVKAVENKQSTINYLSIQPVEGALVYVNGKSVTSKLDIHNGDRVIMGNNHVFKLLNPLDSHPSSTKILYDWDYAQQELMQEQRKIVEKAISQKQAEMEKQLLRIREEYEVERSKQQLQIEELQKKLQSNATTTKQKEELNNEKEKLAQQEHMQKLKFQQKLISLVPKVKEINDIAKHMQKQVKYNLKIVVKNDVPQASIQARDLKHKITSLWTEEDLENRIVAIRDRYKLFLEEGDNYKEPDPLDPFYKTIQLVGTSKMKLQTLAHLKPKQSLLPVMDSKSGRIIGELSVSVDPLNIIGDISSSRQSPVSPQKPVPVENPEELLKLSTLVFSVKVNSLHNLDASLCKNIFCRYKISTLDDNYEYSSIIPINNDEITIDFEKRYSLSKAEITEDFIAFLEAEDLEFEIFGEVANVFQRINTNGVKKVLSNISTVTSIATKMILPRLTFIPLREANTLEVSVVRAEGLPKIDLFTACSPFCKIKIGDLKQRTTVKSRTTKPVWKEVKKFKLNNLPPSEEDTVTVKVYHHNKKFKNKLLGMVQLKFGELQHNQRVEAFHALGGPKCKSKTKLCLSFEFGKSL